MLKNYRQDFVDREASMHESFELKNENHHHWGRTLLLATTSEKETCETRYAHHTHGKWKPSADHLAAKSFKAAATLFERSKWKVKFSAMMLWLSHYTGVRAFKLCQATRLIDVAGLMRWTLRYEDAAGSWVAGGCHVQRWSCLQTCWQTYTRQKSC